MNKMKKSSKMIALIVIIQIIIPIFSIMFECGITLKSIANSESEYYINTAQDLWDFAEEANSGNKFKEVTVYLTANINLECDESNQWEPISRFDGTFKGQGYTISGLYITSDSASLGLFGENRGTIKGVNISDSFIETTTYEETGANQSIGFMVANNYGHIKNCSVINSEIKSDSEGRIYAGGICGYNSDIIEYCESSASVYTKVYSATGGISGENYGIVSKSKNTGIITGGRSSNYNSCGVGGIVGSNHSGVTMSANYGHVKANNDVGGIVGTNFNGNTEVVACYNLGTIEGSASGGIVGRNGSQYNISTTGGLIENSYNAGEIVSSIGGTICYSNKVEGKIQNCYYLETDILGCTIDDAEENTSIFEKTEEEMKREEFIELLNADTNVWRYDSQNINNGYPIIAIQGDINNDGKVNIADLLLVKRHVIAESKTDWVLTGNELQAADIDENEKINITDILLEKRLVLEYM